MAFAFEKLVVDEKAVDFADTICDHTEQFERGYLPSSPFNSTAPRHSLSNNIAEGNGRFTKPDRRNFFTIAPGSAQECVPLLEIAKAAL